MVNDIKNMEEKVYNEIKQEIITRRLYPNTQLVEATIAEKMGVSRTPIRGALKKLAYEGLVEIKPRKGAFIAQPTKEEMMQLFNARLTLEKEAARLAVNNISEDDIKVFQKLLENEKESYQNRDMEKFLLTNNEMHMVIARASKNKYYIKYIEELLNKSDIYIIFYDKFYTTTIDDLNSVREHKCIYNSLKNKDENNLVEAMDFHIKNIFDNLNINMLEPFS